MGESGGEWDNVPFRLVFRGATKVTLDAKGRMVIPTRYRERIQERGDSRLVVTIDRDQCLLIYPLPDWEEIDFATGTFEAGNIRTTRQEFGGLRTTGQITSTFERDIEDTKAVAVYYRDGGIVGGAQAPVLFSGSEHARHRGRRRPVGRRGQR